MSGELSRSHWGNRRFQSTVGICIMLFISMVAIVDGDSGIHTMSGRENLWKAFSNDGKDSDSLQENELGRSPKSIRTRLGAPDMLSTSELGQYTRRISVNGDTDIQKLGNETMINNNATLNGDILLINLSRTPLLVLTILLGVIATSLTIISSVFVSPGVPYPPPPDQPSSKPPPPPLLC